MVASVADLALVAMVAELASVDAVAESLRWPWLLRWLRRP